MHHPQGGQQQGCQWCRIFTAGAVRPPRLGLYRQNPNDLELLNALVNLSADPECWQFLREAGVVGLFVDLMIHTPGRLRKQSDVCRCYYHHSKVYF